MGKILFLLIGFILPLQIFGQVWVARYDGSAHKGDGAFAIAVDDSGNVYVAGASGDTFAYPDYLTIKYNSVGDTVWVRKYDGPNNTGDCVYAITVDKIGNVYVTGRSCGIGTDYDYATIKYNSAGDTVWLRRYDSGGGTGYKTDEASAIDVDDSGNVYVTGRGSFGYQTIKYDSLGVEKWVGKYIGTSGEQWGYAITVDNNGNVYVTGESGYTDYATIKYNSLGDTVWVRTYNGTGKGYKNSKEYGHTKTKGLPWGGGGIGIAVDINGNVYVTGCITTGVYPYTDYATIKYNSVGDTMWTRKYHGPDSTSKDEATALAIDDNGNVYVTGKSYNSGTYYDYATIKYNSAGDTMWVRKYDGPSRRGDAAYAIALDNIGNVYVTGASFDTVTDTDYATIKYNSSGGEEWAQRYNGPGSGDDNAYSIALDNKGYVYVTGSSYGSSSGDDCTTIKYSCVGVEESNMKNQISKMEIIKNKIYLFVPNTMEANIKLYDLCGRLKEVIYTGTLSKGNYTFTPNIHKSGIYFVKLTAVCHSERSEESSIVTETKKMIMIK
ncbi:MAG: SBBP repeat-containing protein [bacterium]